MFFLPSLAWRHFLALGVCVLFFAAYGRVAYLFFVLLAHFLLMLFLYAKTLLFRWVHRKPAADKTPSALAVILSALACGFINFIIFADYRGDGFIFGKPIYVGWALTVILYFLMCAWIIKNDGRHRDISDAAAAAIKERYIKSIYPKCCAVGCFLMLPLAFVAMIAVIPTMAGGENIFPATSRDSTLFTTFGLYIPLVFFYACLLRALFIPRLYIRRL